MTAFSLSARTPEIAPPDRADRPTRQEAPADPRDLAEGGAEKPEDAGIALVVVALVVVALVVHQKPRIRRRRSSSSLSTGGTWVSGGGAMVAAGASSSRCWTRRIALMGALRSRCAIFCPVVASTTAR